MTDGGRDMATATTLQRTEHLYDTSNRISSQTWQLGDRVYTESYSYDEDDGSLKSMQPAVGGEMTFTYDALKRLSSQENGFYRRMVSYESNADGTATTRVGSIGYVSDGSGMSSFALYYDYDERGNIKVVSNPSGEWPGYAYSYDAQGQMTSETIVTGAGTTVYNYTYDTYGNIRSVSGGEAHTYTYGNEVWRDLLTAYDGQAIDYDEIGNPTSYYNGTRWTFQWQKGRQLASATSGNTTASYTYDLNGIRSSKTVTTADGTVTYNYLTQNGKVVRQEWNGNFMDFIYDNAGRPYAIVNGNATSASIYYYVLNQQGDVIRILDPSGGIAATYAYNAWGEVISATGWMWEQNPIRYRGYFQDNETGFYYCQSRYYDPSIGRFINADLIASTGQGFVGHNMFAYCLNNPVIMGDDEGMDAVVLINNMGAGPFGHVGFLAQDENGTWWHFYWGPANRDFCWLGYVRDAGWCKEYNGKIDLDSINESGQYSGTYHQMTYIDGDFSKSVAHAKSYGQNNNYTLFTENCSQVSFSLLAESPTENQLVLTNAATFVIPRDAYGYMSKNKVPRKSTKSPTGSMVPLLF